VQLSAIYHDVVKDRLYTDAANSPRRRSTQTALHSIVVRLCQMLAPMLVFTAEEAWGYIPGAPAKSVHLSDWHPAEANELLGNLDYAWKATEGLAPVTPIFDLRAKAMAALEPARQAKQIGKGLDAVLEFTVPGLLAGHFASDAEQEDLRELCNVSAVSVTQGEEFGVRVRPAAELGRAKCERCWHWEPVIGGDPAHPGLCPRCVVAVNVGQPL
jgi:isoleucyl-tRNA synthetase